MKKIFKSSDIRYINVVSFGNEQGYTTPGQISLFPGLPTNPIVLPVHAVDVLYSNTTSGLAAVNVQAAIDELAASPPGSGIGEAPNDGKQYGRESQAWTEIIQPGSPQGDMLKSEYATGSAQAAHSVDNALFVNGFHVWTAVPANALFTDTVYDDTAIQADLAAHKVDWTLHMGSDQNAAFDGANSPSGSNVLATMNDIPSGQFKTYQHLDQVMIIKADVAQDESILFADVPLVTSTFRFVLAQSVELPATFHIELKDGGDHAHSAPCGDLVITATDTNTYGGGRYGGGDTDYYFKGFLLSDKSELHLELTKPAYLAGVTENLQLTVNENGAPHNVTSIEKVIELIDAIPAPPAPPSPVRNIVKTSSANYTMHPDVDILHVMGAEHHPVAITLPDATDVDDGRVFIIKDAAGHADLHNITIGAIDGQTIDGVRYMYLDHSFQNLSYYTFENNWHVIT